MAMPRARLYRARGTAANAPRLQSLLSVPCPYQLAQQPTTCGPACQREIETKLVDDLVNRNRRHVRFSRSATCVFCVAVPFHFSLTLSSLSFLSSPCPTPWTCLRMPCRHCQTCLLLPTRLLATFRSAQIAAMRPSNPRKPASLIPASALVSLT